MNLAEDVEFEERVAIKMYDAGKTEDEAVQEALQEREDDING